MKSGTALIIVFVTCVVSAALGQTSMSSSYSPNGQFSLTATFEPPPRPITGLVGAPYSANQVNESTQVLSDGTRIANASRTVLRIYRDSAGRIRREHPLAWGSPDRENSDPGAASLLIEIDDPVAGYQLILDAVNRIAHRMVPPRDLQTSRAKPPNEVVWGGIGPEGAAPPPSGSIRSAVTVGSASSQESHVATMHPTFSTESLGSQVIEGVMCEGTRTTTTFPTGAAGNDRPFVVTRESWRSPELKIMVLQKANDPRSGERIFRNADINRSEPDPALFQVPAGYQVVDETGPFTIKISLPKP